MAPQFMTGKKMLLGSPIKIAILLVVLASLIIAGLELTNVVHLFNKKSRPVTASQYTKGLPVSASQNSSSRAVNNSNSSVPVSESKKSYGTISSNTILIDPTGDFVSNHHPNLSGSPAPNTEVSVCNTTPGASCKITFSKDGVTKALAIETTDSGGAAYWSWKLQDIGLATGSWSIQAVATLNGQTKTASDVMALEVSP